MTLRAACVSIKSDDYVYRKRLKPVLCYFTEIAIFIILQLHTAIDRVTVGNSGTSQFFCL